MRALSLTFDDGPDETWTPRVVEHLARCQATATVGERVRAHPELARAVLAAGHEIHRHTRHTELTEAGPQLDAKMALGALAAVEVRPQPWQAPWGTRTDASIRVAAHAALQLVRWSIDTHGWRGDQPQDMLADARDHLADGGAVLMHDAIGPGARGAGCENTIALLPALAAAAHADGLALVAMQHPANSPPAIEVAL